MTPIDIGTNIIGALVILGQAIILGLLGWVLVRRRLPVQWQRWALPAAFIVALASMLGSLFFSEAAKLAPCELCWFQRICMYPQVVLLGLAVYRKERWIAPYSLALALIGAVIAIYHYSIQLGASFATPCSSSGLAVSCTTKMINLYGYMTIPVMALTGFLLIAIGMIVTMRSKPAV